MLFLETYFFLSICLVRLFVNNLTSNETHQTAHKLHVVTFLRHHSLIHRRFRTFFSYPVLTDTKYIQRDAATSDPRVFSNDFFPLSLLHLFFPPLAASSSSLFFSSLSYRPGFNDVFPPVNVEKTHTLDWLNCT